MASIELPPERSAAARARRFVRDFCAGRHLPEEETDDIELLVSELVTNAVLHARSRSFLTIGIDGDRVRVSVEDDSEVMPRLREYGPEAATGRGVLLVDRLATEWGVDVGRRGKCVWFELLVNPAGERSRA